MSWHQRRSRARRSSRSSPTSTLAWEPRLERLHANELPWRAPGRSVAGGPQSLSGAAAARARRSGSPRCTVPRGPAARRPRQRRSHRSARARLLPRGHGRRHRSARRRSACTPSPRGSRARTCATVPLRRDAGFALDVDDVLAACTPNTKLVFLCSPNNPTGNALERARHASICDGARGSRAGRRRRGVRGVLPASASMPRALPRFRTSSCCARCRRRIGLAGARCGTLIANPEIIDLLRKVIPPYAITQLTVEAVLATARSPRRSSCMRERSRDPQRARALRRGAATKRRCQRVWPSDANFLLVECADPEPCSRRARDANLLIRDVRAAALPRACASRIGTPEQNDRLLGALR